MIKIPYTAIGGARMYLVAMLAQRALQRKLMSNDLRVDELAGVEDGYDRCIISLTRMASLSGTSERLIICSIRARLDVAVSTA